MGAIDDITFDSFDDFEDDYSVSPVTCKRCGATELEWDFEYSTSEPSGRRWFLVESDGTRHECPASEAEEFEIVTEASAMAPLSARETQCLSLFAQGHTNSEVAELLGISHKTVSTYKMRIQQKNGLRNGAPWFQFLRDHFVATAGK